MLFSEFKKKEVINLKNCQKLGRVADFEFEVTRVRALEAAFCVKAPLLFLPSWYE